MPPLQFFLPFLLKNKWATRGLVLKKKHFMAGYFVEIHETFPTSK